jgi:predicted esterase
MLKRIFLALVVLSPIFLQAQLVAKSLKAANGQTVGFYEFTPSDYTKTGAKHPLLIFLHGISERGDGSPTQLAYITKVGIPKYIKNGATMRFNVDGKWHSFVVLMPQLSPNYGAWQTFHTDEMINYAIKNLNVDPDRIYLTGLSLGGGGVWSYASSSLANASKLAAIVPVCGTCAMSNAGNIVNGNVAVWAFHGDADTKVSASCSKNAINSIQALKPKKDALLTLYNTTSHVIWDRAYDFEYKYQNPNVWEWMLRQSRSSTSTNKPPVANAGPDQTVLLPGTLTLNGSGSDPDGTISSYTWSYVSGPNSYKIVSPNSKSTEVTNLVVGTYVFRLTVKDNSGASTVDDVTVTVKTANNKPPMANAGPDQTITLPTNSVKISGSATDPDGTISTYRWSYVSGPSSYKIESPNNRITEFTGLVAGTYVFRLTVTDNGGATHYDDVTITVKSSSSSTNKPPVANVGPDQTITLPTNSVKISASATDPDGTISTYRWSYVSGPNSYKITAPNNRITEFTNLVAGTYVFRLTVTDNGGATNYADVTITVKGNAQPSDPVNNQAPVADAGKNQKIEGTSTTLDGSNSKDPDGKIVTVKWTQLQGPVTVKIASPASLKTSVTGMTKPGVYVFRLRVYDEHGARGQDDMSVNVVETSVGASLPDPDPAVPQAYAGKNQKVTGSSTTLDGTGSTGKVAKYEWVLLKGPNQAKITSPNSVTTTVTGLIPGDYIFRLFTYNSAGEYTRDDVGITVVAATSSAALSAPANEVLSNSSEANPATLTASTKLYPNPATSVVNVQFTSEEKGSGYITIYDVAGKAVKKIAINKQINQFQQTVDISGLINGVYYMDVTVNNKKGNLTQFVKQ